MKTSVNILVTCRKQELLPAALLVFKTFRVGFPTAGLNVFGNALAPWAQGAVARAVAELGGAVINGPETSHGVWMEDLLKSRGTAFWICDTDVVFFDEVENWFEPHDNILFAGRYEPAFNCEWTKAKHMARLHPSLMWLNPGLLGPAMRAWPKQPPFFNTTGREFLKWHWVSEREHAMVGEREDQVKLKFYDTAAGLYHALGGTAFSDQQNEAFEHLYCGSYLDLIGPHMPVGFRNVHSAVYADPSKARGMWEAQQRFYREAGK